MFYLMPHEYDTVVLTWVICAEPRHRVDSRLTVVDTDGAKHLSSPLSVLPKRRTNSSINPAKIQFNRHLCSTKNSTTFNK